jgi:hypothetical protein
MRPEYWTSQGSFSCRPWKPVCHDEQLQVPHTSVCQAVKVSYQLLQAGWSVCGFCICGIRSWKYGGFRDEGTCEPTTEMLSREAGPICWHRRSCEFTVLDIFWSNVTECICIRPFGILLIEGLTEIEYVLRPVLFWDSTQHKVIPFHLYGITNCFHLQGSRCPRSIQPAHTGCVIEELTVTVVI